MDSVLCFGGGDWWYHNRAHIDMQIMRRLAEKYTVLYINSIVIQKPQLSRDFKLAEKVSRKWKSIRQGLRRSGEGFWVYSPYSLPVHHFALGRGINNFVLRSQLLKLMQRLEMEAPLIWVACPGACDTALSLPHSSLVLQRTDRWEEFPNVEKSIIRDYDLRLKKNADLTVFASEYLYNEECDQCRRALFLDHGVDYEKFANAYLDKSMPEDIAGIPRPIVGFFGGIDSHTSDIKLIEKITELLPDHSFVFVGKASADCSGFAGRDNVYMLGQKPYDQIPHYGKYFDAAIMPWNQNRWIQACNPIKLKEYLALGKPVISRPFAELDKYLDVVYSAEGAEDFAATIKRAIAEDNSIRLLQRKYKVHEYSWDKKAEIILDKLIPSSPDQQDRSEEGRVAI